MPAYYVITYDAISEDASGLKSIDTNKFKRELILLLLDMGVSDIQWQNKTTILIVSDTAIIDKIEAQIVELNVNVDYFIARVEIYNDRPAITFRINQTGMMESFNELVEEIKKERVDKLKAELLKKVKKNKK